jgi:hypothetical protein
MARGPFTRDRRHQRISYVGSVDLLSMLPTPATTGPWFPNHGYAQAGHW